MSSILHIWKMWILAIVRELTDLKTGTRRKQKFIMSEVLQRVHGIMKRKYFLPQEILFL